jgi:predicted permease
MTNRFTRAWGWLRSIAGRDRLERGLDEEIRFHLDQQTEKNLRAGLTPDEARRQALVRFGGRDLARETARDEIRPALLDETVRDVRYGIRVLRKAPGFTASAMLTLALGIGATSAIFSIVRTVVLKPLPYRAPERVVTLWETARGGAGRNVIAPANFVAWRERAQTLQHLAMIGPAGLAIQIDGQPARVSGVTFSFDAFNAIGVQPALGRAYTEAEDTGGRDGVIVLSYEFWQQRLGGRSDVLERTLATDGGPRTVVGVMPPGFTVVGQRADFLIPYGRTIDQLRATAGRDSSYAIARLRDGVSLEQAAEEMRRIFADREREAPRLNATRKVVVLTLREQMVGDLRPALFALVGAVALVLLVACVNVASLLLARSAAREREVGLRTALGAKRARLVRQMLTESLVLAGASGVAGLAVAALCHRGLLALVGDRIPVPRIEQVTLDGPVVAFTLLAALTTGIVFGIVPALVATSDASNAVRDSGRHGGGRRLHRVLRTLVVAEVALSLVLLAGAGLLMRSFLKLSGVDLGFRTSDVLTAGVPLPATRYDFARAGALYDEALMRISALPGVQQAAGASCLPVPFSCIGTSFWRADRPQPEPGQIASGHVRPVTAAFFSTLGIAHVEGRDFAASDSAMSLPVAIVSQEVVKQEFGGESPLGRRLRINVNHVSGKTDAEWTIVGVVRDVKSTLDGPSRRTIYLPIAQRPTLGMTVFVRSAQDPRALAASVTGIVRALEPEAPVATRMLDDVVGDTIARPRAMSLLVVAFAIVALALAAIGVYGVMAYSVRQRTQEIGVRMALGATRASVVQLVLADALRLVSMGIVAGLIVAAAFTRLLERLLFEVAPLDPWTFVTTALVLLAVAAAAAYVPARRGMQMAPVDALRN